MQRTQLPSHYDRTNDFISNVSKQSCACIFIFCSAAPNQKPSPKTITTQRSISVLCWVRTICDYAQIITYMIWFFFSICNFWSFGTRIKHGVYFNRFASPATTSAAVATEAWFHKLNWEREKRVTNTALPTHIALNSFRLCYYTIFCSFDRSKCYKKAFQMVGSKVNFVCLQIKSRLEFNIKNCYGYLLSHSLCFFSFRSYTKKSFAVRYS